MPEATTARRFEIGGRVQGVGFRPFIYRLATELGLAGWVRNEGSRVTIHVEGDPGGVAAFGQRLHTETPPLAQPERPQEREARFEGATGFTIDPSTTEASTLPRIPPDQALCRDCRAEIHDPAARRYRYPFTNCTACGPRYTLVDALPWDRARTAMAEFPLCPACAAEYTDPTDRRHHAGRRQGHRLCAQAACSLHAPGSPETGSKGPARWRVVCQRRCRASRPAAPARRVSASGAA